MNEELYNQKKLELETLRREAGKLQLEYIRTGRRYGKKAQQDWWITKGNLQKYRNLIHRVHLLENEIKPYEIKHGILKLNLQEHRTWHYLTF